MVSKEKKLWIMVKALKDDGFYVSYVLLFNGQLSTCSRQPFLRSASIK